MTLFLDNFLKSVLHVQANSAQVITLGQRFAVIILLPCVSLSGDKGSSSKGFIKNPQTNIDTINPLLATRA